MASVAALLVLLLAGALPAYATVYTLGDTPSNGWTLPVPVNYTTWASGKSFKAGDSLLFQYVKSAHNVLEVSESNYNSCTSSNPIKSHTDGNTSISLTAAGTRYFICGFTGHCQGGMKVAVTVSASGTTPTTPPPPPSTSASPPSGSTSPPPPSPSGPSSQPPPPPPPSSGAEKAGFYGMNAALLGALLMGLALMC